MKPSVYLILVFLVALIAGIGFACKRKTRTPESKPASDSKTIREETTSFTLSVTYPVTENPAADQVLEDFAKSQVEDFKKAAGEVSFGVKNELTVTYRPFQFSNGVRSFAFELMSYTGGAHPNTLTLTKTFDLKASKEIFLQDVFKSGTDYLKTLSEKAVARLKASIQDTDLKWIQKGAGPTSENFQRFALSEKEILIFFDPYQVAPYSAGPQEVKIPYSELKELLAPPFGD